MMFLWLVGKAPTSTFHTTLSGHRRAAEKMALTRNGLLNKWNEKNVIIIVVRISHRAPSHSLIFKVLFSGFSVTQVWICSAFPSLAATSTCCLFGLQRAETERCSSRNQNKILVRFVQGGGAQPTALKNCCTKSQKKKEDGPELFS